MALIDPSYETTDDYRRVKSAVNEALTRFSTGTVAIWYPLLERNESRQLPEKLKKLPAKIWLNVALSIRGPSRDGIGMHGSGMLVLNPPWTLAPLLEEIMPYLVKTLGLMRVLALC